MTTPAAERRTPMFPTTEGDLWRWQLETMTALTAFIKAHGPGKRGALPAVPWQISTGFHAVARLTPYDSPPAAPRDLRDVLTAYAAALGSEVTSIDLGRGDTEYRVKGTIGERDRITLTLIATIRADDEQADADDFMPWRVYGLPRPGDGGRPWLVNAFTTKQGAERFAEQHPEHGPLTIVNADDPAPDPSAGRDDDAEV